MTVREHCRQFLIENLPVSQPVVRSEILARATAEGLWPRARGSLWRERRLLRIDTISRGRNESQVTFWVRRPIDGPQLSCRQWLRQFLVEPRTEQEVLDAAWGRGFYRYEVYAARVNLPISVHDGVWYTRRPWGQWL